MNIKKTVGLRINSALAKCGMLQKDLAKVLGVTDNTISYYCKGVRSPQLEQLPKIAEALNTTTDYLLGITDDPNIQKSAIDELGITPAVADRFIKLQDCAFLDCDIPGKINRLLENESVWHLLLLLKDYATAAKADRIYDEILPKHQHRYNEEALIQELLTIAEQYHATDVDLYDFLHAKAKSIDLGGLLSTLGMEDFNLRDLLSAKVSHQLEETLYSLERGEKNGID